MDQMTSNDISFARSFKASKAGFAETTGVSTAGFEYLWQKGLIVTASVFLYVWALNFMTYQAIGTLALPKHIRPKPGMFDFRALRKIHPGPDSLQAPLSFQVQGANLYGVELEIGLDLFLSASKRF